jgi:transposase-like protein
LKVTHNFVRRYGVDGLTRLLEALSEGRSGAAIAREFSVSRERVRQWKNAFGQSVMLYQVYPEVRRALAELRVSDS